MRMLFKTLFKTCAGLLAVTFLPSLTACNDDLPADSYYTFTGEMMSDFLQNHEDFSLFAQIVERAGRMDFLASRGYRTLFPPVNQAVEEFLDEYGFSSVDDIPVEYCDTLVKTCMIENSVIWTYNLAETSQERNGLGLPLVIRTSGDTVDASGMVLSVINRRAAIINAMKNDSVENGVVHPVDKVIVPSTTLGSELLDVNHSEFTIYYEALRRTALLDSLYRYRDDEYEAKKEELQEFITNLRPGNYTYMAKRPDHRYEGFTVLVVPDRVLYQKYPDRFNEAMSMDEKIEALYNLAAERYGDAQAASIFGLDKIDPESTSGETYKERNWNMNSLNSRYNPLNMFLSYHIIDRMFASTDKLINCWGVNTALATPTEWVSTLLDFSTIKLERVYSTIDPNVKSGDYYINHSHASNYNDYQRVAGAKLEEPGGENNFSLNLAYYYLDDVVAYDQTMRNNVMHTRMRMDFVTLWPELTNNDMRLNGDPREGYSAGSDNSETGGSAGGFNYYCPDGYIKGVEFSENSIFMVQRPKLRWWSWGGDEIDVLGSSYDVTFTLPNVPPGTYELRLGYPGGVGNRGIAQVYFDGKPQGLPIDMRYGASDSRVAGLYNGGSGWRCVDDSPDGIFTSEQLEENARVMKNNGYYSGGKSMVSYDHGTIPMQPEYSPSFCTVFYNIASAMRRKVCDVVIEPNKKHTVRFRSVFAGDGNAVFVLEYMELVPISICGPGGIGEDLN